jgi:SM-20-related protein
MIRQLESQIYDWEQIAQQLASQSYTVVDHFLSPDQVTLFYRLALEYYQSGQFKSAGVGRANQYTQKDQIRGDRIFWLEEQSEEVLIQNYWEDISRLRQYLNRSCFLGLRSGEFHFAVYPVGAEYKRHLDVFKNSDARKISVIVYLNPVWDPEWGGALRLFLPEGELDIHPLGGRMVCMRSELIEHAVLPVKKERYSLTGWLKTADPLLF